MNKTQFDFLITNLAAIINHTFTMQCGEFATAMSKENEQAPEINDFDTQKHLNEFNFDAMLQSGYAEIPNVSDILDQKRNNLSIENIEQLLANTPTHLADLKQKLTGSQLRDWVTYALAADQNTPLYQLHAYITNHSGSDADESAELIREAIAFDEVELLRPLDSIKPEYISMEDLIMAATIQSFRVFAWLADHAHLNDDQKQELLVSQMDFPESFATIYTMLAPSAAVKTGILGQAQNHQAISEFLDTL